MSTSLSTLRAYQVFFFGELAGIYVAARAAQAKAAAVADYVGGGFTGPIWKTLRALRVRDAEQETLAIEKHEDAGKYWRDTRAFARRQAECDTFNASWPVGTAVEVVNCCESGHWPEGITFTRTPAWAANENCAFVSLEGYAGGFYLKNVRPLIEPLNA